MRQTFLHIIFFVEVNIAVVLHSMYAKLYSLLRTVYSGENFFVQLFHQIAEKLKNITSGHGVRDVSTYINIYTQLSTPHWTAGGAGDSEPSVCLETRVSTLTEGEPHSLLDNRNSEIF